jgi:uncharacterized protein (DUF1697 family)
MRYIALLRGINVGGQKSIKMADLKKLFEDLGLINVKTYVQSGNVIFDYDMVEVSVLADKIEEKINQIYGFSVKTIIRTRDEIGEIISNNPFVMEPAIEIDKLHITLMLEVPAPNAVLSLDVKKEENEKFLIISREVYLYCPNGYGNTKLNNALFEKKLKTVATTRNWRIINKLLEMSE